MLTYSALILSTIAGAVVLFLVLLIGVGRKRLASPSTPASRFPLLEKLSAMGVALFFVLLVLSGFWYLYMKQPRMTGNALMLHVSAGSVFTGILLIFVILRAEAARFGAETGFHATYKVAFWGFLLSSVVLTATAIAPMHPWLGMHGQEAVVAWHRYAAVPCVFFGLLLGLLRVIRRPKNVSADEKPVPNSPAPSPEVRS